MPKQKFHFAVNIEKQDMAVENEKAAEENIEEEKRIETINNSALVSEMLTKLEMPKEKTPLDCFKIIPRNKLRNNKKNKYPIIEMESLKDSILHFGLSQDITAVYIMEEDMYVIEAGHRRRRAIDELIEEFSNKCEDDSCYQLYQKNVAMYEKGYVVKVISTIKENDTYDVAEDEETDLISDSVIDSEIRLIITNEENRTEDPVVKAQNIKRLAQLYKRKNITLPSNERININEQISKDMNMSARSVAYYKSIDKLIPELKEGVSEGKISIVNGASLSRLSSAQQSDISEKIKEGADIQIILKEKEALKKQLKEKDALIKKYENEAEKTPSNENMQKLLKADMRVKASIDQATSIINTFVKNIAELNQIRACVEDKPVDIGIIGEEELNKSKQVLIDLLS